MAHSLRNLWIGEMEKSAHKHTRWSGTCVHMLCGWQNWLGDMLLWAERTGTNEKVMGRVWGAGWSSLDLWIMLSEMMQEICHEDRGSWRLTAIFRKLTIHPSMLYHFVPEWGSHLFKMRIWVISVPCLPSWLLASLSCFLYLNLGEGAEQEASRMVITRTF